MGDRSGSREPKLSSLKKSKKNPGAPAGRVKKAAKSVPTSAQTLPPPAPREGKYFDCGVALLSRQFDRDRDRVLGRAQEDKVSGVIAWFSDIEKQQLLVDLSKSNSGFVYFVTGIHPDNIERTNKKSHDSWIEKIEDISKRSECVGILTGLNLSRDIGTHFPQESMLRASCAIAEKVLLPLIVHCPGPASLDRAVEILKEEGLAVESDSDNVGCITNQRRVIIYDPVTACGGDVTKLSGPISCGFVFIASAVGLLDEDSAVRERAKECIKQISISNLLSCTDSPWRTPQNIPDPYLRTLRNEPCNIAFVNSAIAEAFDSSSPVETSSQIYANAMEVFGLEIFPTYSTASQIQQHDSLLTPFNSLSLDAIQSSNAISTLVEASETIVHHFSRDVVADEILVPAFPKSESDILQHQIYVETNAQQPTHGELQTRQSSYYGCIKCRTNLFNDDAVSHHAFDTSKTVFKVGEEGSCHTVVFIPCNDVADLSARTRLRIHIYDQKNVDSSMGSSYSVVCECGCKLGKFYNVEAYCACGAQIQGPVARLLSAKMDYFDLTLGQEELIHRARQEAEELIYRQGDGDGNDTEELERVLQKKAKKKGKQLVHQGSNKGNFSSFRNKSFVPNASRKKSDGPAKASGSTEPISGNEFCDGDISDEYDDEDDEDMPQTEVESLPISKRTAFEPLEENKEDEFDEDNEN